MRTETLFEEEANETAAEFARRKIRAVVDDPEVAHLLCPDNIFGCKRLCVDTGYHETYNLPHVKLVDVAKNPIERITQKGVVTGGTEYEADIIVCATGFAAMTGSFDKIRITGRDGLDLTKMGSRSPDLSRPFYCRVSEFLYDYRARQSVRSREYDPVDRAACGLDGRLHEPYAETGAETIEPTLEEEDAWVEHVNEVAAISLRSTCSSWYVGANISAAARLHALYRRFSDIRE